jgi:hypothetical protein
MDDLIVDSYSSVSSDSKTLELPETSVIRDVSEEATSETSFKCFSPLLSCTAKVRLCVDTQNIGMTSFVMLIVLEEFVTMSDSKAACLALCQSRKLLSITVPKQKTCLWVDIFNRNNT